MAPRQKMSPFGERAREQLPTLILTLLSIVQALALELLWSEVRSNESLLVVNQQAVLGWLQALCVFIGIVVVWQIYVANAVRFRWTPGVDDLLLPFLIGIIEFVLVDTMGPENFGIWFGAQALIFAIMSWVSQHTLRRARLDGDNDEYFRDITPATRRDHLPSVAMVAMIGAVGWALAHNDYSAPWAIAAVATLAGLLGAQVVAQWYFYERSMRSPARYDDEPPV